MEILKLAELLKGEPIVSNDGIDIREIEKIEKKLSISIPESLRDFYFHIGNLNFITQSFERFLPLNELEVEKNKLYFLEENQSVCSWAVDLDTLEIYQDNGNGFYNEKLQLDAFIKLIMYYNCAQGGLPFVAQGKAIKPDDITTVITDEWETVVNHNGLLIFANKGNLIWGFLNGEFLQSSSFFLSFRNAPLFEAYCQKLNAVEL